MRRAAAAATLPLVVAFLLAACAGQDKTPNEKNIGRADLGDDWPLTVDSGAIACRSGSEVVFIVDDATYAVNGTAKSSGRYRDLKAIWAEDPSGLGLRKGVRPLIERGLELC